MATIAIGISKGGGGYTATVPVNSLSEDGVAPEEGDSVQCSVEGTVQSVSGKNATVSIESINGEPVGAQSDQGSAEDQDQDQDQDQSQQQEPQTASGAANAGPAQGGGGPLNPKSPAGSALLGAKLRKAAKNNPVPLMRMGGY